MADSIFKVSHSKMATFRRCLQQYQWKYGDKFFPPSALGQIRGTCGHAALADWHSKYTPQSATQAAWDLWAGYGYGENEDWQMLNDALDRYYAWSIEHDTFKIVTAEQEFEIRYDIPTLVGKKKSTSPVLFTGFIDGVVEEKGKLWLLENKFYQRMASDNSLDMDQQVSLYLLASHLMEYDVQGVIYNMVRVASTKIAVTEPVVRKRIFRNKAGLNKVQDEMLVQVAHMLDYTKKGGRPYRNPTKDCNWDCAFYSACLSMTEDGQAPTEILQQIANIRKEEAEDG